MVLVHSKGHSARGVFMLQMSTLLKRETSRFLFENSRFRALIEDKSVRFDEKQVLG